VLSADKISASGGAVVVAFNRAVELAAGVEYWCVISRAKNPTHPNSENYYHFRLQPGGYAYPAYIFREDTDEWLSQGSPMAFQFFGRVDEPGGKRPS